MTDHEESSQPAAKRPMKSRHLKLLRNLLVRYAASADAPEGINDLAMQVHRQLKAGKSARKALPATPRPARRATQPFGNLPPR